MTTFSQLVDKMVAELKRPDLKVEVASYANQTIREMHFEPTRNNSIFYPENAKEAAITATSDVGQTWSAPKISTFQGLRAVRFDSVQDDNGAPTWAEELKPGSVMGRKKYFYYRASSNFAFTGYGGIGGSISLAWYEYPCSLAYYAAGLRPCEYDEIMGFSYLPSFDIDSTTRQTAQDRCTNWLLLRWGVVIEEGIRAKVFKRLSDDVRARQCYSMYLQQRQGVYTAESAESGGM